MLCVNIKPKILCCSEARITCDINDNEFQIDGYNSIVCYSNSKHTGGVIMYVKKPLKYKLIKSEASDYNIWMLAIEIIESDIKGVYIGIYRSPNGNYSGSLLIFDKFLESTLKLKAINICMGDINIDFKHKSNKMDEANQIFEKHGLKHCMNDCTRITNTTQSQIDVVLTNIAEKVACELNSTEIISDHETIIIQIKVETKKTTQKMKEIISWKSYNKDQLIENLRKCEWNNFYTANLNGKVEIIRANLNDSVMPMLKKVVIKNNIQPKKWFDEELLTTKREKINSHLNWKLVKSEENWNQYIKLRNIYNKMIKEKNFNYTRSEIKKSNTNQVKMWSCLRKLMPNKIDKTSDEIIFENKAECDEKIISNKFNEYFINSIIKINSDHSSNSKK